MRARVLARIDVVLNAVLLRRESAADVWSEATSRFGRHLGENVSFAHGRIDGSIGEVAWADLRWVPNLFARRVSVAPC